MPRVSIPPYPIAGGVDDLDEDTPPIVPQFPGECSVKSSSAALVFFVFFLFLTYFLLGIFFIYISFFLIYFFITYFPQLHFQCYLKSPPYPPPPLSYPLIPIVFGPGVPLYWGI
jgi:hypothetical protein